MAGIDANATDVTGFWSSKAGAMGRERVTDVTDVTEIPIPLYMRTRAHHKRYNFLVTSVSSVTGIPNRLAEQVH